MRKGMIAIVSLAAVALLIALGGFFWWQEQMKPVSSDKILSDFVITRGTNAEKVGQDLYAKGFIRNPFAFKLYVQLTDKTSKVQAGQFKLSPSYSMEQIVDSLSKGPTELWVTIPEGLRREEVVEKVIAALEMEELQADTFRTEFLTQTKDLEGMLFPDTYLFARDANAAKVVSTLKNTFDKRIETLKADIAQSGYTQNQTLVMASILERETKDKDPNERPTVAGILYNRLRDGMPLQADATLQYALTRAKCRQEADKCNWWPTVYREDYTFVSPYNTYANKGLPPAPVSNPGLSALKAAANPTDSDYFYYIHEENGTVHYAKTLVEHNENVRVYLSR
jgi:UPF0755 protein